MTNDDKLLLLQELKKFEREKQIRLARDNFFKYCNLKAPTFFKYDRKYLVEFCKDLENFFKTDEHEILVVNMPPRHGKSRTVSCFVEWVLGNDQNQKIMTGSYNEMLSTMFSKNVRNTISEEKADLDKIVFSDVFPNVSIKKGDGAMNMWSLANGYNNYLATSPTGTATGFGASLLIIDDLIKSALEANNSEVLDRHWEWFTNTMLSRLEEGGKIIIVMTRWHSQDLAGRVLEHYKDSKIKHIMYKAVDDDGEMLCPEILSKKSYDSKVKAMGLDIAEANYQQKPIDLKGRLYTSFKTYSELPKDKDGKPLYSVVKNYTDTADCGNDYLCSINYVEYNGEVYITDILYTKDGMEITEPKVAKMLFDGKVNISYIESNNGGRGFARNVNDILKKKYNSNLTTIKPFFQSKNKNSRILSNSTWVMEHIYFPSNWNEKYAEYYQAMATYQREGKNAHDDAPDATTGIAEKCYSKTLFSFE